MKAAIAGAILTIMIALYVAWSIGYKQGIKDGREVYESIKSGMPLYVAWDMGYKQGIKDGGSYESKANTSQSDMAGLDGAMLDMLRDSSVRMPCACTATGADAFDWHRMRSHGKR